MDFYEMLQVSPGADREVIKAAYRAIMSRLGAHPDHGGDPERAAELTAAWNVLSDATKRRDYDRRRRSGTAPTLAQVTARVKRRAALPGRSLVGEGEQTRQSPRLNVDREVLVKLPDGRVFPGALQEVSSGGARLRLVAHLGLGSLIELSRNRRRAPFATAQITRVVREDREFALAWVHMRQDEETKGVLAHVVL